MNNNRPLCSATTTFGSVFKTNTVFDKSSWLLRVIRPISLE